MAWPSKPSLPSETQTELPALAGHAEVHDQYDRTTTGNHTLDMNGGSTALYLVLRAHLCVPLLYVSGDSGLLDFWRGGTSDHFRCAVAPLSGYVRCSWMLWRTCSIASGATDCAGWIRFYSRGIGSTGLSFFLVLESWLDLLEHGAGV